MSEKRRSSSIDKASGSDAHEKGLHQDIVGATISLSFTTLLCLSQDALAEEMEALGPDLLEATAHAKTMSPEEIEETIDYILNEVFSFAVVIADFPLMFLIERSMGRILSVIT